MRHSILPTHCCRKSIPRRPDPISNSGTKSSPRQNMYDWYLPRTSSRFLNSVGKTESGGSTRFLSGKLRTAPKRCFPLPAAWPPPYPSISYTLPLQHAHPLSSQTQTQLTTSIQASFPLQKLLILYFVVLQSLIMVRQFSGCCKREGSTRQGVSLLWGKEAVEWGKKTWTEGQAFFFHHSPTRLEWWLMLLKRASLPQKCGLFLPVQQRAVWRRNQISHQGTMSVLTASGPSSTDSCHPASFTHTVTFLSTPTWCAQGLEFKDAGRCLHPSSAETIIRRSIPNRCKEKATGCHAEHPSGSSYFVTEGR